MFKKERHFHTSSIKNLPCSFDMLVYQTVDWNDPTVSKSEVVPVKRIMKKIPSDPQTSNTWGVILIVTGILQNYPQTWKLFEPEISFLGGCVCSTKLSWDIEKNARCGVKSPRIHGLLTIFQNTLLRSLCRNRKKKKNRFALISNVFHMFSSVFFMCYLDVRATYFCMSFPCPMCFPCLFSMRHFSIWNISMPPQTPKPTRSFRRKNWPKRSSPSSPSPQPAWCCFLALEKCNFCGRNPVKGNL